MMFGFGISAFFPIMFTLVILIIVSRLVRHSLQYNEDRTAPVLIVDTKIVSKRMSVGGGHYDYPRHGAHTRYFVTFEVESGDRIELALPGREYGMLAEGDTGKLTFRGTEYMGFRRSIPEPPPIDYRNN